MNPKRADDSSEAMVGKLLDDYLALPHPRPGPEEFAELHPEYREQILELLPTVLSLHEPSAAIENPSVDLRLGGYRVIRELGRGGMGVVYEAVRDEDHSRVALKTLLGSMRSKKSFLERFRLEASATAQLEHSHIIPVHEVGEQDGVPFYAMPFVDGIGLDEALERVRHDAVLPGPLARKSARPGREFFRDVARLGLDIAEALAFAHGQGVLHRDVKPSNLLLDRAGKVWLTDFGLCKTEEHNLTQSGRLIGTLRYLAPESLDGKFDVQTDVYGLGATLYELVSGSPAVSASTHGEILHQIVNRTPSRLSERVPGIPRDLARIIHRSIEKDPAARYPTAEALAEDLRAFLEGRPISSRVWNPWNVFWVGVRRHKALSATVALALVLLVGVTGGYVRSLQRARADEASARTDAEWKTYVASVRLAGTDLRAGDLRAASASLDNAPEQYRGWEYDHLRARLADGAEWIRGVEGPVVHSPDGKLRGMVRRFSVVLLDREGREIQVLRGHRSWIRSIEFHPDGERILTSSTDSTVRIWSVETGEAVRILREMSGGLAGAVWSRDGQFFATAGKDRRLRIWDGETAELLETFEHPMPLYSIAFHPDGERVATGSSGGAIRVWEWRTGKVQLLEGHLRTVRDLAFSPDGRRLASGSADQTAFLWLLDTPGKPIPLLEHESPISTVAFDHSGNQLVTGDSRGQVHIWDGKSGDYRASCRYSFQAIGGVSFDPQKGSMLIAQKDGVLARSSNGRHAERWLHGTIGGARDLRFDPTSRFLAVSGLDTVIRIHDLERGTLFTMLEGHHSDVHEACFTPDGTAVISIEREGRIIRWDWRGDRTPQILWEDAGPLTSLDVTADGRAAIVSKRTGEVVRVELDGSGRRTLAKIEGVIVQVCCSADGRWVTFASRKGGLHCVAPDGSGLRRIGVPDAEYYSVAFSPRDGALAAGTFAGEIHRFELDGVGDPQQIGTASAPIKTIVFHPTEDRLVTGPRGGGAVIVWSISRSEEVLTLQAAHGWVQALAISPDGETLAAGGPGGTVRIWSRQTTPGEAFPLDSEIAAEAGPEPQEPFGSIRPAVGEGGVPTLAAAILPSAGDRDWFVDSIRTILLDPAATKEDLVLARERANALIWHATPTHKRRRADELFWCALAQVRTGDLPRARRLLEESSGLKTVLGEPIPDAHIALRALAAPPRSRERPTLRQEALERLDREDLTVLERFLTDQLR